MSPPLKLLPLYQSPPRTVLEYEAARRPDPGCRRCALGAKTKHVCGRADGESYTGHGGTLVVGGAPTKAEDYPLARPLDSSGGRLIRTVAGELGVTNLTYSLAVRCAIERGQVKKEDKEGSDALRACRGYLVEDIRFTQPARIVAIGDTAARALLGDDAPRIAGSHRAVGWLSPSFLPSGRAVPVFVVADPLEALRIRTLMPSYRDDLQWAFTGEAAVPPWGAKYAVIDTPEDAVEAARQLREAWTSYSATDTPDPYACSAFDIEAAGQLWSPDYRVLCAALAPTWLTGAAERAWLWTGKAVEDPAAVRPLLDLLADPAFPIGGQNVKYDACGMRTRYGIEVRGIVADTKLMSRLAHPDADADLDSLGWSVSCGGHKAEAGEAVKRAAKAVTKATKAVAQDTARGQGSLFSGSHAPVVAAPGAGPKSVAFGLLPTSILYPYNGRDAVSTGRLITSLSRDLRAGTREAQGARWLWDSVIGPATEVFARMEARGFPIDRDGIFQAADIVSRRIAEARQLVAEAFPGLDPDSPDDIGRLLYGTLGLTTTRETDSGKPSTDRLALAENADAHPGVKPLMDYGELTHLRNTYLDGDPLRGAQYGTMGLLRHLRAHPDGTWRAHTTYNLDGARSGRLSSSDPNLQNVPRAEKEMGKLIKDLFLAPLGRSWVQLDYSQLELRVAALETGDPVMIAIFAAGGDYHLRTAELIAPSFGLSPAQWIALSKEERKSYRSFAKTVNFGVLYGMGVKTLAARMKCDIPTAQRILDAILGKMAKLKAWIAAKRRETQVSGLVWTSWQGKPAQHRSVHRIEYTDTIAVNGPIQGGASYFCTASVNSIERGLEADGLDTVAEMVGTVHDSILLLVEDDYVQEVASVSAAIMEGWTGADSPVKLMVDAEYGKRWGSLTHLDLVR